MAYTGFRVTTYIDVNPSSPTFQTTREERTSDAECSNPSGDWQVVSEACEVENGKYTGYMVRTLMDTNRESDTYGNTRVERTQDLEDCPLPSTNPRWVVDDTYPAYCEVKYYEPAHVEGNTGQYIARYKDINFDSSTYMTTVISSITDTTSCPVPNTEPEVEAIISVCELVDGRMTGYESVTGIDKNVYSETYLSSVSLRRQNEEACPPEISCDDYHFSPWTGVTIPYTSGYTTVAQFYDLSGEELVIKSKPAWITDVYYNTVPRVEGKIVVVEHTENETDTTRTGVLVLMTPDSGCEFNTIVTQEAAAPPVDCSVFGFQSSSAPLPYASGTTSIASSLVSAGTLTANSSASWLTMSVETSGNRYYYHATYSKNESGGERSATITYTSGECEFTQTVTQEYTSCDAYEFSGITSIPNSRFTNLIATTSDALPALTWTYTTSAITRIAVNHSDDDVYKYTAIIEPNTGSTTRDINIYYSNSSGCNFTQTISQAGGYRYSLTVRANAVKANSDTSCLMSVSGTVQALQFTITFADGTSGTYTNPNTFVYQNGSGEYFNITGLTSKPTFVSLTTLRFSGDTVVLRCSDASGASVGLSNSTKRGISIYYTKNGGNICNLCADPDTNYITFTPRLEDRGGSDVQDLYIDFDNSTNYS